MITTINWPNIFNLSRTNVAQDKEAVTQSLKLLLQSEQPSLFGDPGYGVRLRKFLYDQSSNYLVELIREEIYEAIKKFIPQISVQREDITFTSDDSAKTTIYVNIVYRYVLDSVSDMLRIKLVEE